MTPNDLTGLVPRITREGVQAALDPYELQIFEALVSKKDLEHHPEVPVQQLLNIMEKLNIIPVWGLQDSRGAQVYRMHFGDCVPVFTVVPGLDDVIPSEVLTRTWTTCASLDELVDEIRVRVAPEDHLFPEDHPELSSVGFICPELNHVWLVSSDVIASSALVPTRYAQVFALIQTNEGRVELARRLITNDLMTHEDFQAQFPEPPKRSPEAEKALRRHQQENIVNTMTAAVSGAYSRRFLRGN